MSTTINRKQKIIEALREAFGGDDFYVTNSGIGPGDAAWFAAVAGPLPLTRIRVEVEPEPVSLDCETHGFAYAIGSVGCPDCLWPSAPEHDERHLHLAR